MKKLLPLILAFGLTQFPAVHANPLEEELLEAKQAFALTLKARDADTLEAQWKVAKGYYLYRSKFKYESLDSNIQIGQPVMPAGIVKHDEFFGEVETYRNNVTITLPLVRNTSGAGSFKLRITSQGCADIGVCYPPMVQELTVKLPAAKSPAGFTPAGSIKSLGSATNSLGGLTPGEEFLKPDEAFIPEIEATDSQRLTARVRIAPGYYLYADKTRFELVDASNARLTAVKLPKGQTKIDPYIGKTEIYHGLLEVTLPLERDTAQTSLFAVRVYYQGCAEQGICYPPAITDINVVLPAGAVTKTVFTPAAQPGAADATPAAETAGSAEPLLLAILGAFGVGLLLTFTPCVLPMIPILSGIIVRSGDVTIGKLRGGLLSYSYVLGTAVTYTAAGILAGATGGQLQAYFQNPWAIGTFTAILLFLALSMFGLYELQMPASIQSRLHYHTHKVKGGTFIGAFILGLVSALIVGACVSPVLMSVLGAAIVTQDPVLGGSIMFAMAHGQGVILVALGVGAGFLLPKAGPWMDNVKYVFGVLLIGVAIYLLGVLPQVPVLLLWAALFVISAVYLGATQSLPSGVSNWRYLWKGVGTLLLIWGVLALFGGLTGGRDILNPLPHNLLAAMSGQPVGPGAPLAAEKGELFKRYTTLKEVEDALAAARAAGKPAVLDFYASWCTDCVRMEKSTLSDARVQDALGHFVLIQADVTETSKDTLAIKQRFRVLGPPAMLFFAANGEENQAARFYGYRKAEEFLALLAKL